MTVRILGRSLALLLVVSPVVSFPLGLGEGTVDTHLNLPIRAEIKMVSAHPKDYVDVTELEKQVNLMQALAESRRQANVELSSRNRALKEIIAQQDRMIKLQRKKIANLKQRSTAQVAAEAPDFSKEASLSTEPTGSVKPTGSDETQFPNTAEQEASRGDTVYAVIDFFTIAFILSGVLFFIAGSIGILRLPDVYSRLHALTKADNVGLGLLVTGVLLMASDWLIAVKLVMVWVLVLASSAASAHLIAQRARRRERYAWKT